jgi:hypothetical protein
VTGLARTLRLLGLFVLLSLASRALALAVDVIDMDETLYAVAGAQLLAGRDLYVDVADPTPPLVFVFYALARLLLGGDLSSVRLLVVVVVVPLTALALSAFYRHDRRGLLAALLYLVYGAAFLAHDVLAANREVLLLLPAAWAVVLFRDEADVRSPRRGLLVGALLGVAALVEYQAALWLPAPLAAALLARGVRRAGAVRFGVALGVGFLLPLLASYAFFAARGAGGAFLYWNLGYNLAYTANPVDPVGALERFASYLLPFGLVTLPLFWGWRRSLPLFASRHQALVVSSLVWLSLPAAFLGFRFYPHDFVPLYGPLALAAAPAAAELLRRPGSRPAVLALLHTAAVLFGFTALNAWLYGGRADVYPETRPVYREIAARLAADPCREGASLFVWGHAPAFYYASGLPPASRFLRVESTLTGHVPGQSASPTSQARRARIEPRHWDWLLDDLERNHVTYVLDTTRSGIHGWESVPISAFPRLSGYLAAHFESSDARGGVEILRRRGCRATSRP